MRNIIVNEGERKKMQKGNLLGKNKRKEIRNIRRKRKMKSN